MKKSVTTHKARKKVILGFLLAIFLVLSVGGVTYYSLKKLLGTVETLSEPSERVRELNGLLADVYQLDRIKGNVGTEKDSVSGTNFLESIEERLNELEKFANDSSELAYLKRINFNVNELVVVYNGLEEVKLNLLNRNFSQEALRNIETKIKRQEEINRLQNLGRIRLEHKIRRTPQDSAPKRRVRPDSTGINLMSELEKEDLRDIFKQFSPGIDEKDTVLASASTASDSILYAVKKFLLDINIQERRLRSSLANLEAKLREKNRELIADTQKIISSLQNETLRESQEKNDSLYELTFKVSILLGILIFIGIAGSFAFIYSILMEINKDESHRAQLEIAKERSDNLAKAKQDFLANMSHEIRNPLHAIQGYNSALRKTNLSEDQRDYTDMVDFAANTLSGIVNDILDFSKLEAGKISIENTPFEPKVFFLSLKNSFELKAREKQLEFIWNLDLPEDKWLVGDELRISQILNNLIGNALKFTDEGKVEVSVIYKAKGFLEITVEDTGIGMTKDFMANIFAEFNQGDSAINRKYGGTGLGLAIVKRMVDLLKGQIKLDSRQGEGTQVYLKIPMEITSPQLEVDEIKSASHSLEGLSILLVDDDPVGLKFAKLLLESNGAHVQTFRGGLQLKNNFEEKTYDLALLDIQMPEVSGFEALQFVREKRQYKDLPAIAITANVFAKEKERMKETGFGAIVLKPFKEDDLIREIAKVLKLKPVSPQVDIQPDFSKRKENSAPYDVVDLRKFCMGDEDLLLEVLTEFCMTTTLDIKELDNALLDENWNAMLVTAHKLGSRLGQLKIQSGKLARDLEEELKGEKVENASALVQKIKIETNRVIELISMEFQLYIKTP